MLETVIVLLSFFSLTWAIQNVDPISIPRNWLMRKSVVFFKLLSCSYCTGFYSGLIIYLAKFAQIQKDFSIIEMFLWGLASAGFSFIITAVIDRISILKD